MNYADEDVQTALHLLGYDQRWLHYGFVDEPLLMAQLVQLQAGDDPNTEHYRYGTIRSILASRSALDDEALAHLVEVLSLDDDQTMAQAALIELMWWPKLTAQQRDWLRSQPALDTPVVQRAFARWQDRRDRCPL